MSTKLLTIVVPSYNAAEYLPETIPTMAEVKDPAKLEILIVNDGSKDNTLEVAQQLKEQYPETVAIIDKENGGHGSTINAGIKEAKGKYFKVVDADDWVNTENLSQLMDYLMTTNDDEIVSPFIKVYNDREELESNPVKHLRQTYAYDEFLIESRQIPLMHSVTVKTEILRDNAVKLDENCFYVDMEYNVYAVPFIKTISYFELPIYRYRLDNVNQSVSMASYIRNVDMHATVIKSLVSFYNDYQPQGIQKELIEKVINNLIHTHLNIYLAMDDRDSKKRFMEFDKEIKNLNKELFSKNPSKKIKVARLFNYAGFRALNLLRK